MSADRQETDNAVACEPGCSLRARIEELTVENARLHAQLQDERARSLAVRLEELTRENVRLRAEIDASRRDHGIGRYFADQPWARSSMTIFRDRVLPRARFFARTANEQRILILISALSLTGFWLVLFATSRHGLAVSPDSVNYLGAARDLLEDGDLLDMRLGVPTGFDYDHWPPLFPILIALVSLSPLEFAEAARLINAAAFGGMVAVAGWWLHQARVSLIWLVLGCLTTLFAYPVFFVSTYAWSEPTFSLWLLVFATVLARYVDSGSRRALAAAAGFVALAWLTRYAGVILFGVGLAFVLLRCWRRPREAVVDGALFGAMAATAPAAWLVRNYVVSSAWMGTWAESQSTLADIVRPIMDGLAGWFLPASFATGWRHLALGATGAALVACVVWLCCRDLAARERFFAPNAYVLFAVVVVFVAFLIYSATRTAMAPIEFETRLLSPIAVPLLLLIAVVGDTLDRHLARIRWPQGAHLARGVLALSAAAWLLFPAGRIDELVERARASGAGYYATDAWAESQLLARLRDDPPDGCLISNYPEVIAYYAQQPAGYAPYSDNPAGLQALAQMVGRRPCYLVWFQIWGQQSYIVSVEQIRTVVDLEPLARSEEGAIYRMYASDGAVSG